MRALRRVVLLLESVELGLLEEEEELPTADMTALSWEEPIMEMLLEGQVKRRLGEKARPLWKGERKRKGLVGGLGGGEKIQFLHEEKEERTENGAKALTHHMP